MTRLPECMVSRNSHSSDIPNYESKAFGARRAGEKNDRIVLVYAEPDEHRALNICEHLRRLNLEPWMYRQVLPGELLIEKTEMEIRKAHRVIVCLSSASSSSGFQQRLIKKVLEVSLEKTAGTIYAIPLLLEECAIPDGLGRLNPMNWFKQDHQDKLVQALRTNARTDFEENQSKQSADQPLVGLNEDPSCESTFGRGLPTSQPEDSFLPIAMFRDELANLYCWLSPSTWRSLPKEAQDFLSTLGVKLEPILQIVKPTPVPLVIGFECLAISCRGENFAAICRRAKALAINPGHLRLLLMLAAMKTAEGLRNRTTLNGHRGAKHLVFAINLDPETLDCCSLRGFLRRHDFIWEGLNLLFEVSEQTSASYLDELKNLKVEFQLRYSADDYNAWNGEVKDALKRSMEMSKIDCKTFTEVMGMRGQRPKAAITQLCRHQIPGKPLIIEGLENESHLDFLSQNWPDADHSLLAQGYLVEPGSPWNMLTHDLKKFGLPGGYILAA